MYVINVKNPLCSATANVPYDHTGLEQCWVCVSMLCNDATSSKSLGIVGGTRDEEEKKNTAATYTTDS